MRIQLSDHFTYSRLIRFTFPSICMMIFTSIYGIVDGIFVSNFVGTTAFAGLNLIMPLLMICGAIGFMFGTGGAAIIGKTLGEGKNDKANEYFSLIVYFTFGAGLVVSGIGQIVIVPVAKLLGASGALLDACVLYGRISLITIAPFMLQFMFQILFTTAEKPKLGFYVTLIAGCSNMVLDFLFIAVFGWGIAGAAAATGLSEVIGAVIAFIYFIRPNDSLLRLGKTHFYGKVLLKAATNGISEMLSHISESILTVLYNWQLLKLAGEDGVAAFGIIMYVTFIFFGVFIGYIMGVSPIISYNYGAQNHAELQNVFKKTLKLISLAGLSMFVIMLATAGPLASIFVSYDENLMAMTVEGIRIYSVCFLVAGFSSFGSFLFTALNNGIISGIIATLRAMVFECGAILIIPNFLGLTGVWVAYPIAEALTLIVVVIVVFKFRNRYHYI